MDKPPASMSANLPHSPQARKVAAFYKFVALPDRKALRRRRSWRFGNQVLTRLRAIDCSIIPGVPSGNTNAPAMAIGSKAAELIAGDHAG